MLDYAFLDHIKRLPFVEAIYVFGSHARGDAQETSDIDLAIVCPQADEAEWLKVVEIIDRADTLRKVDCLRFDTLKNARLKAEIERDKVVVYERA